MRALTRLVTVAALVATALLVPTTGSAPDSTARAADMNLFDAGNIISDAVFFDALSMDALAIERFLDAKGTNCVAGTMPCLKDYTQDTADQAADNLCAGYRGALRESAGTIIAKSSLACGINPRVLLVLLQKEQSLVTRTKPGTYEYQKATGFGCPDTAPCNPAFQGLVSQVYFAARQFQRYRVEASRYGYKAGRTNTIQYHPNIGCGTSQVYIANQATAGLYNYTPYRPTQAALFSGPAGVPRTSPDFGCATYGNRNFWTYFTDWFGSTQSPGAAAILEAHSALGGPTGRLGGPTSGYICGLAGGGCFQNFQFGAIYWSHASGAHAVGGAIGAAWAGRGWETGSLGYPTGGEVCGLVRGGCLQSFQKATLYYSPATGAVPVAAPITAGYHAQGWERGVVGYPVADRVCGLPDSGCFQVFQGGIIYASKSAGAHAVRGAIFNTWGALGWERGWLGYPTGGDNCGTSSTGCSQNFQNGSIHWSPSTGAVPVRGTIGAAWKSGSGPMKLIGYPTGGEVCGLPGRGCFQPFAKGAVYYSPATGAQPVRGAILGTWGALGWERSWLGYPTGGDNCGTSSTGCSQNFQHGTIHYSPGTGAHSIRGAIAATWTASGGGAGSLGYPTGEERCGLVRGGCFQTFAKGSVYWSPATGARAVSGAIRDAWGARGWEVGALGYPVEEQRAVPGGVAQRFQGGTLTVQTATGTVTVS
ncbi:LGFP repeat-containing protein [Blastococcus sp. LR1]|uniref:LGFP repeat-containing protein n=1 Tax=Blastococcus sp. LR1 TaxID=2877000 RepID=UPI001CCAA4A8|nr:hypothetical protein [Blastococcus sp. LR1]MCA0146214.1 hypothetical protein [Blastococcus sp. LR1]